MLKGVVHGDGRLGRRDAPAGADGLDGDLVLRLGHQILGCCILKDLDTDITGRHVLIVEDIVDSGLTLSWLAGNLRSRSPASLAVCAMLRKPGSAEMQVNVAYTGLDIGDEFVVGYTALTTLSGIATGHFIGRAGPSGVRGQLGCTRQGEQSATEALTFQGVAPRGASWLLYALAAAVGVQAAKIEYGHPAGAQMVL